MQINTLHSIKYLFVPSYKFLVPADGIEDIAAAAVLTNAVLLPVELLRNLKKE